MLTSEHGLQALCFPKHVQLFSLIFISSVGQISRVFLNRALLVFSINGKGIYLSDNAAIFAKSLKTHEDDCSYQEAKYSPNYRSLQ